MGAPTYRSSYSEKGSTSSNRISDVARVPGRIRREDKKTSMAEMLELLEEVERCREVVAKEQGDLDSAKKDLEKAERKVAAQINKLDPETKAKFRRMMGGIDSQEQGER